MAAHCASLPPLSLCAGDAKSDETANKEAGEEKPEEDNDYHRSDEQVRPRRDARQASYARRGRLQNDVFFFMI